MITSKLFELFDLESALLAQRDGREVYLAKAISTDILNIDEIERTINFNRIVINNLSMSRDEEPIEKSNYSDGVFVNPELVGKEFEKGASIIIRAAHKFFPAVSEIINSVQNVWKCECQGNLYISREGVNATYPHFDPHELYIFQLYGVKKWDIFEGLYEAPEHDDGFDKSRHGVGELQKCIELSEGDVLFLPRGRIHRPIAVTPSIHLAVGIKEDSVGQVLRKSIHVISSMDVELRRLAYAGRSHTEISKSLAEAARRIAEYLEDEEFSDKLLNGIKQHSKSFNHDQIGWLREIFSAQR